jgi:hypothetical protein
MLRDHWADRRKGPPLSRKPIPRQLPWRCGTGRRNESGGFSIGHKLPESDVSDPRDRKQLAHSQLE